MVIVTGEKFIVLPGIWRLESNRLVGVEVEVLVNTPSQIAKSMRPWRMVGVGALLVGRGHRVRSTCTWLSGGLRSATW